MEELQDRIQNPWGVRTPYAGQWPARVDAFVTEEPERWVQSACVLCSHGCALDIGVKDGAIVGVRGRGIDRVNLGRLGPKGLHGWEANGSSDRLKHPLIRDGAILRPATWNEAMDLIVRRTKQIVAESTASAIGFYTSGQLFIEDYYTLAVAARAGLGTPHLDGNTRLCTATASESLKESFGSDGQPGTFSDLDTADTIFIFGQNMAETKTVLWSRILDRRQGPRPPKLIVADPRTTPTARAADVHLALRAGSNLALMNGLLHLVIEAGRIDEAFIREHTVGFAGLKDTVRGWTPERTEQATGVPVATLRQAADLIGASERLVSTVLQGVYQSRQATASAVQVNNLHLIRGMIGKPGCSVFQMNGQPTAQNTRETGCDGGMPAFRNWENAEHMKDLARVWNVEPEAIPHWGPPTPILHMLQYAEQGSLRMLWISGTNPAVTLPELRRIKTLLAKKELFVVVNDGFPTETTALADVVLPAAIWGEKTGTFTNSDRTVHLSLKAVEPPGESKSDFEIFLDFARRMDFKDKSGRPLIPWSDPEGAFNAWKECSRGWPCDYSGLSYEKLSAGSGIQWPCTETSPRGTERLYTDGVFATDAARCQSYGHDLVTGAAVAPEKYKAANPSGRAIIKSAEVEPPTEAPDETYPFMLTTGRVVYHFHTRTKTGRSRSLSEAAPDVWVEVSSADAGRLGIADGDLVEVQSRRGKVEGPARIAELPPGHLFIPFHFGWWDAPARLRTANELTKTEWDPVSKQPVFKQSAAALRKIETYTSATPARRTSGRARKPKAPGRPPLADMLALLEHQESRLLRGAESMVARHPDDPEVAAGGRRVGAWSKEHLDLLAPLLQRLGGSGAVEIQPRPGPSRKSGALGLLKDLQQLWSVAQEVKIAVITLTQAARGLRDRELETVLARIAFENERQIAWIQTKLKHAAPQALIVP